MPITSQIGVELCSCPRFYYLLVLCIACPHVAQEHMLKLPPCPVLPITYKIKRLLARHNEAILQQFTGSQHKQDDAGVCETVHQGNTPPDL